MKTAISNIHATKHTEGRYALNWSTATNRFHVWGTLTEAGALRWEDTIYKNPLELNHRSKTIRLNRTALVNKRIFDNVLLAFRAEGMLTLADAAYQAERDAEAALQATAVQNTRIREAAPHLLEIVQAVRNLEEEPGVITTGRPLQNVVNAARNILQGLGL